MENKGKRIIITGGTGLVGSELVETLSTIDECSAVIIFTRKEDLSDYGKIKYVQYRPHKHETDENFSPQNGDYIVHLAGAGIADQPWSEKRKKVLHDSRVNPIKTLFKAYTDNNCKPAAVVSASGVNCYDTNTENKLDESHAYGDDYLSGLVKEWEDSVSEFSRLCRVVILRLGIVLTEEGGALQQLRRIVKKNLGAPLGKGAQPMPFVQIDDVISAILFAIDQDNLDDTYNCVATDVPTNEVFMEKLGRHYKKKIWRIHVPSFVLKIYMGKMASMLLQGVNPDNAKLKSTGFTFQFDRLDAALEHFTAES